MVAAEPLPLYWYSLSLLSIRHRGYCCKIFFLLSSGITGKAIEKILLFIFGNEVGYAIKAVIRMMAGEIP
jgi:hypothetical protein